MLTLVLLAMSVQEPPPAQPIPTPVGETPKVEQPKTEPTKPDPAKPDPAKPDPAKPQQTNPEPAKMDAPSVVVPPLPPKEKLTPLEAKLDSPLRALTRAAKSKDATLLAKTAHDQAIALSGDQVAVKIVASAERDLVLLKRRLAKLGGKLTTTFQNTLFATVPVRQIETLAKEPKVLKVMSDLPADIKDRDSQDRDSQNRDSKNPDSKNPSKK